MPGDDSPLVQSRLSNEGGSCQAGLFRSGCIVWSDPDLLEIETRVAFAGWSARERAYVTRDGLREFARALDRVVAGASSARLDAGQPNLGYATLDLFEYSRARHIGLHVTIGHAPDSGQVHTAHARELRFTVPVECGQLALFANDLRSAVQLETGEAFLPLPPNWLA